MKCYNHGELRNDEIIVRRVNVPSGGGPAGSPTGTLAYFIDSGGIGIFLKK
jgi:hypothetical protein